MDYGIPIPKPSNYIRNKFIPNTQLSSSNYQNFLKLIYDDLVNELPENASKNNSFGGGQGGYVEGTLNVPNIMNANRIVFSHEGMIGINFNDIVGGIPFSNKSWNTTIQYGDKEPDLFFVIRHQHAYTNAYMELANYSYSDDRIIAIVQYRYTGGGYQHQFILDITQDNSTLGYKINIYFSLGSYHNTLFTWIKLPMITNGAVTTYEVIDDRGTFLDINVPSTYYYNAINIKYIGEIEYHRNIKIDLLKNDLNYNLIESFNFGEINKTEYYESYRNVKFYENHNYDTPKLNLSFGKVSNIDKSDWKIYNENWIADLNKDSILKPYVNIKGFIEGKQSDYVNETNFVYNSFNSIFKTIKSFNYDFDEYVDSRDISIIVDGRRRYIDINKPMLKGYISGKVNTSGCSGQLFKIRCYRHSNIDFIGEYDVDVSGNYFIPNLNYLDEYDIMLVDSNSVIETKVSSKRKPILNDEIKSQKLEVHTSSLNMDLFVDFRVTLLYFRFNKPLSGHIEDLSNFNPKPYTNYVNYSTSYTSYINYNDVVSKYYFNSNAHILDVRYRMDSSNPMKNSIMNDEWEIEINFDHWGHSYSQWNSLFSCSDTVHGGNFMFIYQNKLRFEMVDKTNGKNYEITTTDNVPTISTNRVYNLKIIRTKNSIELYLDKMLYSQLDVPNDFDFNFDIIKIGCAWNGSQFWGNYYDFKFRIL